MKVSDLLSTPEKWTRGCAARDSDGDVIDPNSPDAVCWCIIGATRKVYDYKGYDARERIRGVLANKVGHRSIQDFNDDPNTTFEMVREVILEAGV